MRKDRASWGYRVGETWGWRGGFLEDEETHRERCLGSWIGAGLRALAGASRSKGKENSWSVCKGGMGDRAVQGVEWVQRVRGEAQPGGWVCRAGYAPFQLCPSLGNHPMSGSPDWLTGRLPAVWFAFAAGRGHSPSTDALASACSGNKDGLSGPHALGEHV